MPPAHPISLILKTIPNYMKSRHPENNKILQSVVEKIWVLGKESDSNPYSAVFYMFEPWESYSNSKPPSFIKQ